MQLLIATTNQHKLGEYRAIFADLPYTVVSLRDVGITDDVEETGTTFAANAILKAEAYCKLSGLPTLADDSGLEIAALDGRPGVYSARYGGPGVTPAQQHALVLGELAAKPDADRTARFVCVIALARPGAAVELVEGELVGTIADAPQGTHGFGYDPLFWLPERGCTVAALSDSEKNAISHRGRAAQRAHAVLQHWIAQTADEK